MKIASYSPIISHLFFAMIAWFSLKRQERICLQIRRCLLLYERASGQMVNFDKSAINFLPTAANLHSKYVPTDGFCSLCRLDKATTCHCLFFCPKLKQVWKDSIFWIVLKECKLLSFVDCCMAIWTECGRMSLNIFVVLCWAI